jgi:hypothetical protein
MSSDEAAETIDGAEEIPDPWDELVEQTKQDPGAPFAPDVLTWLATLRRDDPAGFERLRRRLKNVGCRVTQLDRCLSAGDETGERAPTQTDILIQLAQQNATLFRTSDRTGYADLTINGHRQTWPLRSAGFKLWLVHTFHAETEGAPRSEALTAALNQIEAAAHFDAPERIVYIRVGELDGRLYVDLANAEWQAVEIDADGWRVIDDPPVRFRRCSGMLPLPTPTRGGSINDDLRPFLNVESDDDFVLLVAWLQATFRPRGPYPVLGPIGEHGAAKSTLAIMLRALIDPNLAPLRRLPREDRDMFIQANNAWTLGYDNLSRISDWVSDTLCCLATGGGFGTRKHYSDSDEALFNSCRPIILIGIEGVITRPDLADRSLLLALKQIPEDKRQPEKELLAKFDAARPKILGALLDTVAQGIKQLPETKLTNLPRMADFALWATACETRPAGTFAKAYGYNIAEATDTMIGDNIVASAIRSFMGPPEGNRTTWIQEKWEGTASDLLKLLRKKVGEPVAQTDKDWPKGANVLSGQITRLAPVLRRQSIDIKRGERVGHKGTRKIIISIIRQPEPPPNGNPTNTDADDADDRTNRTQAPGGDADDRQQ